MSSKSIELQYRVFSYEPDLYENVVESLGNLYVCMCVYCTKMRSVSSPGSDIQLFVDHGIPGPKNSADIRWEKRHHSALSVTIYKETVSSCTLLCFYVSAHDNDMVESIQVIKKYLGRERKQIFRLKPNKSGRPNKLLQGSFSFFMRHVAGRPFRSANWRLSPYHLCLFYKCWESKGLSESTFNISPIVLTLVTFRAQPVIKNYFRKKRFIFRFRASLKV